MAFLDLTPEQQSVLADYTRLIRAWCGEQARTNNHADAINSSYSVVQGILAELQGADVVLDGSGLAGASPLTKDDVVSITANLQGILTNYNTLGHRQLYAKAAGASNLIG